ncbi:MAG: glutathione S-transferase family protein [Steroidobacteraceae bacterium]
MELYHSNMSVCAQKVRLVLREKNLKPIEHLVNLRAGDQMRPEYLKLNPNGVVPTLVDRGVPIIESTVICEYLEDTYPEPSLRPKGTVQRAAMRLWTMRPDTGVHHACGVITFAIAFRYQMLAMSKEALERHLAQRRHTKMWESLVQTIELGIKAPQVGPALKAYDQALDLMGRQLNQTPWLAGDEYTLADVAMLPYVCRLEDLNMSWMWDGERAAIGAWLTRCKARPNFSGMADYLDANSLKLMSDSGRDLRPNLESILKTEQLPVPTAAGAVCSV